MFNSLRNHPSLSHLKNLVTLQLVTQQDVTYSDGTTLPMTVVGNPNHGSPVLMLHAFGMDSRQFIPFILSLLKTHCFYLPHFRGFGLAAAYPTTEFNFIEQYADDVDVLLTLICRHHLVPAVPVAAISMGALVMWAHFQRYTLTSSIDNDTLGCLDHSESDSTFEQTLNKHHKVSHYLNIDQSPMTFNQPDWQGGVFGHNQQAYFKQFQEILDDVLPYLGSSLPKANNDTHVINSSTIQSNIVERDLIGTETTDCESQSTAPPFSHLPYAVKRDIVAMEEAFSLLSVSRAHSHWLIKGMAYQPDYKFSIYDHSTWQQKMRCLHSYLNINYDYRTGIEKLDIPVIMLIGGKSKLYDPIWQRKVADKLPNGQAVVVAQSGHAIPMDAPIAFTKAFTRFLTF